MERQRRLVKITPACSDQSQAVTSSSCSPTGSARAGRSPLRHASLGRRGCLAEQVGGVARLGGLYFVVTYPDWPAAVSNSRSQSGPLAWASSRTKRNPRFRFVQARELSSLTGLGTLGFPFRARAPVPTRLPAGFASWRQRMARRHHVPFGAPGPRSRHEGARGARPRGPQARQSGGQVDELLAACWRRPSTPGPTRSPRRQARSRQGAPGRSLLRAAHGARADLRPRVRLRRLVPERQLPARIDWEIDLTKLPVRKLSEGEPRRVRRREPLRDHAARRGQEGRVQAADRR